MHIGAITATFWVLLLNAIIGYQLLDDGTVLSVSLVAGSMLLVFLGTGYITMDSRANSWSGTFLTLDGGEYRNYALYALYLLFPIVAAAGYFILETVLVLHVLEEKRPMGRPYSLRVLPWFLVADNIWQCSSAVLLFCLPLVKYSTSSSAFTFAMPQKERSMDHSFRLCLP